MKKFWIPILTLIVCLYALATWGGPVVQEVHQFTIVHTSDETDTWVVDTANYDIDGHWTSRGHELAARALFEYILSSAARSD